jgi:hypothetical protein
MKISRFYFLLPLLLYASIGFGNASAQSGSVQGIITNESGDLTLAGANIVLQKISDQEVILGSATDRNGFYRMGGLEPGHYLLRISHVGFITYSDTLNLKPGLRLTLNAALILDLRLLDEVHVAPSGGIIRRGVEGQIISASDLDRIPTPAGGGDLANYLQTLPGVVSTSDRGGQLFIRGGTPSQNMVLIDGTLIYQPFHIIGFYSAFPQELVSTVDFYPGGFGSRYNNRISSVLDVKMRDGNRQENRFSASLSPFLGEFYAEGPIKKDVSSWIVSGRNSLIEQTSTWFLGEQQPLRFNSQFIKISHRGQNNSECSAKIMRTSDQGRLDFVSEDVFRWSNFVLGGRCVALPESSESLFEIHMGISNMSNSAGNRNSPELTSGITRANVDLKVTSFIRNVRVEYGGYMQMKWISYDLRELFQTPRTESEAIMGSGIHMEATLNLGEWAKIKPGLLLSVYLDSYKPSLEPRARFTWNPFRRESEEFTAAFGLYRQALVGVSDMRDVSSVFVAWMLSPIGSSQMEAWHAITGWNQSLGSYFSFSAEGYYKRLRNLPITVWSTLARLNTNIALADGNVYGSDVRLEYNRRNFYGFAGYGYTWTEYSTAQDHFNIWFDKPVQRFHPPHDRRHQFNAMLSMVAGLYKAGIRWELGSGLPFTQPMGFDELIRFDERIYDVRQVYGNPRLILEKPYQGRLPTYHRLDVSLERAFHFPSVKLDFQVGAINLYNQQNLFYYDIYTQRQINQLPFTPYFSIKMEVR